VLFSLATAALFIRPGEIFLPLEALPIYLLLLMASLALSLPAVMRNLTAAALRRNPAILCVLGLLPAIVLSHLSHFNIYSARMGAMEFGKVLVYYVLLIGLVNTPGRLRRFLIFTSLCIFVMAGLALLQYYDIYHLQNIEILERGVGVDPETGRREMIEQLRGSGIFSDPNDLSIMLTFGLLIGVHLLLEARGLVRLIWAGPVAVMGYAFALTRSRGGFLALLAGAMVLLISRFGWRRSIPLAILVVPAMLLLFAGRQTDINMSEGDTAYGRVMLWRDGMHMLRSAPLFGFGYDTYADEAGQVAHNSFVHAFAELGLFGGILFCGAIYLPLINLHRAGKDPSVTMDDELCRWRPTLMAMLAGYTIGLCSLSRDYVVSTYVILGVGTVCCMLLANTDPDAVEPLSARLVRRVVFVGMGTIVFFYLFVRVVQ
jgi:O-antigen ligase